MVFPQFCARRDGPSSSVVLISTNPSGQTPIQLYFNSWSGIESVSPKWEQLQAKSKTNGCSCWCLYILYAKLGDLSAAIAWLTGKNSWDHVLLELHPHIIAMVFSAACVMPGDISVFNSTGCVALILCHWSPCSKIFYPINSEKWCGDLLQLNIHKTQITSLTHTLCDNLRHQSLDDWIKHLYNTWNMQYQLNK